MRNEIDPVVIQDTLPKIQIGVEKYIKLMQDFRQCDVSQDRTFQKYYNGFYRMRQRSQAYYHVYFEYMEKHKSTQITFENVLTYLYENTSRIEASFSSKMISTIDPMMPVWDSYVLSQLGIKPPVCGQIDKAKQLRETNEVYTLLLIWYEKYLQTQNAEAVLHIFDSVFPDSHITNVKKIDLALWSMGKID